jgi:argininosuccinate lyase
MNKARANVIAHVKRKPQVNTMTTNKMWGGRFKSGPAAIMEAINASIDIDKRLAVHDLEGSDAHAAMLAAQRIIGKADADAIRKGLQTIAREIKTGKFPFRREFEDIHMTSRRGWPS